MSCLCGGWQDTLDIGTVAYFWLVVRVLLSSAAPSCSGLDKQKSVVSVFLLIKFLFMSICYSFRLKARLNPGIFLSMLDNVP